MTWDTIIADWAADRCLTATQATIQMSGKPEFMAARKRFTDGACERVVRLMLDRCLDRPSGPDGMPFAGIRE